VSREFHEGGLDISEVVDHESSVHAPRRQHLPVVIEGNGSERFVCAKSFDNSVMTSNLLFFIDIHENDVRVY
jgi:hypothetical protein